MIDELSEALSAFLISLAGVGLALWYARRAGLIDVPNDRSSHSLPTPRGGGIAIVSAVLAVAAYQVWQSGPSSLRTFWLILGAACALTFVGWMDDKRSIRVGIRLWVHFACGFVVAILVNEIAPLPGLVNVAWLAWWVFWTVASINIVNFMDGVDGMIALQGIVYGLFLFVLSSGATLAGRFGLVIAAACLGFLAWNWPPARMFMGDVGSGPLGLFFVIGGALAIDGTPAPLVFLPLFPLFLDALLTIVVRFRRGEKLTDAHRSHLYQRLANGGYSHARVTSMYAVAAIIGALVAMSVKDSSSSRMTGAIFLYVVLVLIGWKLLDGKSTRSMVRDR